MKFACRKWGTSPSSCVRRLQCYSTQVRAILPKQGPWERKRLAVMQASVQRRHWLWLRTIYSKCFIHKQFPRLLLLSKSSFYHLTLKKCWLSGIGNQNPISYSLTVQPSQQTVSGGRRFISGFIWALSPPGVRNSQVNAPHVNTHSSSTAELSGLQHSLTTAPIVVLEVRGCALFFCVHIMRVYSWKHRREIKACPSNWDVISTSFRFPCALCTSSFQFILSTCFRKFSSSMSPGDSD